MGSGPRYRCIDSDGVWHFMAVILTFTRRPLSRRRRRRPKSARRAVSRKPLNGGKDPKDREPFATLVVFVRTPFFNSNVVGYLTLVLVTTPHYL